MKQLIVIRHAKSSWEHPTLTDHQRPLNQRGNRDAVKAAHFLVENKIQINKFYASDAARAKQTAVHLNEQIQAPIEFTPALYRFDATKVLDFIACLENDDAVAIVGHNPALSDIVFQLSNNSKIMHLPTCAIAVLQSNVTTWQDFCRASHTATLQYFFAPKKKVV